MKEKKRSQLKKRYELIREPFEIPRIFFVASSSRTFPKHPAYIKSIVIYHVIITLLLHLVLHPRTSGFRITRNSVVLLTRMFDLDRFVSSFSSSILFFELSKTHLRSWRLPKVRLENEEINITFNILKRGTKSYSLFTIALLFIVEVHVLLFLSEVHKIFSLSVSVSLSFYYLIFFAKNFNFIKLSPLYRGMNYRDRYQFIGEVFKTLLL